MAFQPERFGKYYLLDKIAIGGMAEIFKAKQLGERGFEKILVIKRILSHLSEDKEFIDMFVDEAKISSTLAHSNIIHVYDFGQITNNYFIAMEYCDGKDLKTVMKKCQEIGRPLPIEYAIYIIHEVCKGLDYAHRKKDSENREMNILHRDVSPSNIMISYDEGKVKLADFGIAKAENATYKTKAGVLKGKFEYMSPEQAHGLSIDRRSDLFAVGICFYEVLTRRRLFKTDSDLKTLELIRNPLIPPPSHLNPQVREDLDTIVMKALARNPEERYQEAWQMQHDLREVMRSLTPPTSPDMIALSLANFMKEIFEREIKQDQERFKYGSKTIQDLVQAEKHEALDPDGDEDESWEIPSGASRVTSATPSIDGTAMRLVLEEQSQSGTNRKWMTGVGLATAFVLAIVAAKFLGAPTNIPSTGVSQPSPVPGTPAPSPKGPLATLILNARPVGARILLNGAVVGNAPLKFEQLRAGTEIELRVEQDGYSGYHQKLLAQPGGTIELNVELTPLSKPPNVPKKSPTPIPTKPSGSESGPTLVSGRIEFFSTPSRAKVKVNGNNFCETPCAMESGKGDATYDIEIVSDGHLPYRNRIRYPTQGSVAVTATLKKLEIGYLTLSTRDELSAEIFIDGEPRGLSSSLTRLPLPAGRHVIRLRNQVAGLDRSFPVDILPGQESRNMNVDLKE